jgi:Asp-tRNA(Asn)/Glu-tRNA(Gln) amidotransferase B subunit
MQAADVQFEAVIGIETHVQINTRTKAGRRCSTVTPPDP